MDRPDVEAIHGIPPAIAIEQKNSVKNARSTVGTASEIYDYLRLLFAKIGEVFCPDCHIKVSGDTVESVVEQILSQFKGVKLHILSPVSLGEGQDKELKVKDLVKSGYYRIWEKGQILDLTSLSASEIQDKFSPSPSPLPRGERAKWRKKHFSSSTGSRSKIGKDRGYLEAIQRGFQVGDGKRTDHGERGENYPSELLL
jgi:hypothetical protein